MKKIIYSLIGLISIMYMFSCKKHMDQVTKQVVIDTTLTSGAVYQLNLQPYGDADDVATITKQGSNYSTSAITNPAGNFAAVFNYSAITKTSATDQVVIAVTEGNNNNNRNGRCGHHGDSTIVTINFTIK